MILLFHLLAVIARLLRPGGGRTIVAENLLLKQQLLLHSRSRSRAPNLSTLDRVLPGFWTLFLNPGRITRVGIIVQAGTLLKFHDALNGVTPAIRAELTENKIIDLNNYHWKSHCRGLYQTPMAA